MSETIRIWHQSMAELGALGAYGAALDQRIPTLVSAGTTVDQHGAREGSYLGLAPAQVLKYPVAKYRIHDQILGFVRQAEEEGYDAFCMATFAEPLLNQARSLVDIPVTSMLESSLLVGCTLARKLALVTLAPGNVVRLTEQIERHGLQGRIGGIYPLDPPVNEFQLAEAFASPQPVLDAFAATASRAVSDGADCVIPAEGVFTEVLAAQKVDRIEGAAVLDCMAVAMQWTEMMVRLRRTSGIGSGRRWDHARLPEDLASGLDRFFGPL